VHTHGDSGKKKVPFNRDKRLQTRTRLRKDSHLPQPALGREDRKEGTRSTITPGQGHLLGKRNTS